MGIDRAKTGQGRRSHGSGALRSNMSRGEDDRPDAVVRRIALVQDARQHSRLRAGAAITEKHRAARMVAHPETSTWTAAS